MRFLLSAVVMAAVLSVASIASAETASTTLTVVATFNSRTSLSVSADVLQFEVVSSGDPAVAMVDFSARARTAGSAQVVLSVEPLQDVQGPSGPALSSVEGPADPQASLTFSGVGEGTLSGAVAPSGLTVASRWTGSGLWHGTLMFALRATAPGKYTVPVRFVLSAP
jgi:hypothetical protein